MEILIGIIVMLVFFGAIGFVTWYMLRKTTPSDTDSSKSTNISTAQEFLPFNDIRDGMIVLPGQKYRAIIECSSINYQLKTANEREQIEVIFQRFLNTITFPITFFLQTKTIDNTNRLQVLDEELAASSKEFPGMEAYAKQYRRDMTDLNHKLGNSHQKKRYIIVNYDDALELDNFSKDEQELYAVKELHNRCNILMSNLDGVGIHSHMLTNEELIELVYSCYNRDNYSYSKSIANGDAFGLFVDGKEDKFQGLDKAGLLQILCSETVTKIQHEGLDATKAGSSLLVYCKKILEIGGKINEEK